MDQLALQLPPRFETRLSRGRRQYSELLFTCVLKRSMLNVYRKHHVGRQCLAPRTTCSVSKRNGTGSLVD